MAFENIGFSRTVDRGLGGGGKFGASKNDDGSHLIPSFVQLLRLSDWIVLYLMAFSFSGPRLKLLSCADCDLGPLGWCVEGGQEFWLLCERVGYRA